MMVEIDHSLIASFKKVVENSTNFVIVPHVNPDGDAIGSTLALCGILRNMGKKADVVIPNDFPDFLQWIPGSDEVIDFSKKTEESKILFDGADVLFCLDFNEFDRSEGMKNLLNEFPRSTILIDHHPYPKAKCDVMISYPAISSTCELLFRVMELAGWERFIDKYVADAIYTGMMTDTGNFSYNASDPETYHIIAKLLEKGIDKDIIHSNIYHTFSEDRWRLIGHALKNKMVILPEYRTGYITLSKAELDQFNFQPGDTEGLVNYPLMVKDIVFCVFFMEKDDKVKVSLRSKGTFATNLFSNKYFNGGGHLNASGGESLLSLKETEEKFLSLLPEYKEQLLNSF
jgi:bifunctional oligoribonuclease and PAP phosphatase NrnA